MSTSLFTEQTSELHRHELLAEAAADRIVRQAMTHRPVREGGRLAGRVRRWWPAIPTRAN